MNLLESKQSRIYITDRSNFRTVNGYIHSKKNDVIRLTQNFFAEMKDAINIKTTRAALQEMTVPIHWRKIWEGQIKDFVENDMTGVWIDAVNSASAKIHKRIELIQEKQDTGQFIKEWMDVHAGELIVELNTAQYNSIHALLVDQVNKGITSPYVLSKYMKYFVGLTSREALAVARHQAALIEEGLSMSMVMESTEKYAEYLHGVRARRIARTELSFGYNHGQMDAVLHAEDRGYLPGKAMKEWMTGGPNPCERCESMDGERVSADDSFSEGVQTAPLHPNCSCSVAYFVYRF